MKMLLYSTTSLITGITTGVLALPTYANAESTNYQPLTNVPRVGDSANLEAFLNSSVTLLLVIAAVLAVIMIVVGGVQYMTGGESPGKIEAAKGRIWGAVIGLLLALLAWLFIATINPDLLNTDPLTNQGVSELFGRATEDIPRDKIYCWVAFRPAPNAPLEREPAREDHDKFANNNNCSRGCDHDGLTGRAYFDRNPDAVREARHFFCSGEFVKTEDLNKAEEKYPEETPRHCVNGDTDELIRSFDNADMCAEFCDPDTPSGAFPLSGSTNFPESAECRVDAG